MESSRKLKQQGWSSFVGSCAVIASLFFSRETAAARRSAPRLPVQGTSTHAHLEVHKIAEVPHCRCKSTGRRTPPAMRARATASKRVPASPGLVDPMFLTSGDRFDPMNGAL